MVKNLLKIAFRNIIKHKGYSLINIIGLTTGIACSILILLFVDFELSYDKFHQEADKIHRVAVRAMIGNTKINQTYSSAITFQKLLEDFPEIKTGVKIWNNPPLPVIHGDINFPEPGILAVDSTFFDVFTATIIHGEPAKALAKPNTMVITSEIALKYFDRLDVLGEILKIDFSTFGLEPRDFQITGITEGFPVNAHMHFDILISLTSFPEQINETGWTANNFVSYIVLHEGASKLEMEEKLKDFTRKYMGGDEFDAWVAEGNFWEYYLQPVTEIHLASDLNGEFEANGNETYVKIFLYISIFILIIACINFMNLSTAKASMRAREVGMRKVIGSGKTRLIAQFLGESIIMSFIALALALVIVHLLLPGYGNLVGRSLELKYFDNYFIIPSLISLALLVGIISGSYPAFFLSSFKPVEVLKTGHGSIASGSTIRKILVVFQFSISIFLIIGTLTVYKQITFFQNKNLGFDKEQILVIKNPGTIVDNITTFKEALQSHNAVMQVSGSNILPGTSFSNIGFGAEDVEASFTLNIGIVDDNYDKTLKIGLAEGRFFSRDVASDSSAAILNERAVKLLGWEEPLGKKINNWSSQRGNFSVIGVVKDFHYESLHQEIRPMALFLEGGYYKRVQRHIAVRLQTDDIAGTMDFIKAQWDEFAPDKPFEYSFLDEDYEALYANEQQTQKIFTIFSIIAIFIACLGLSGLASFTAERRTKEIGIRKVFGASITVILKILNQSFVKWILIASVVAWPVAWLAMRSWLENFAYRIDISWWVFVVSGLVALLIALFIVTVQTLKSALRNPADSLRYE